MALFVSQSSFSKSKPFTLNADSSHPCLIFSCLRLFPSVLVVAPTLPPLSISFSAKTLSGSLFRQPFASTWAVCAVPQSETPVSDDRSDDDEEENLPVGDPPLEAKLVQKLERKMKMKLAKKVRLRRKKLVRKRRMRKKGRWSNPKNT
ncbi:PREDICTED: 50S ribosomal protein 5 alpha, chloroplastic-like [Tarenaya hassleriana]|uniref:50S ribosomal protein 5 alpha, chloroplastic-like n=1 Tax=Tarenaya hassleriana TaxID=28532 RepID=UPI00053C6164|nr:PREDICTED: 50S ribosomal protein 5 alpha, chloroplastic-like [Tarenaya hassleriana]